MSDEPGPAPVERRLNPRTILLEIVNLVRQSILPVAVLLLASGGGERPWFLELVLFGVLVSLAAMVMRYLSLRYGVADHQLVIRSGILQRRLRRIPISKIQNIDLKSGPLQRALGVVEVKVETAGSGSAEAHLRFVGREEARLFREELLALRGEEAPESDAGAADDVVHRASLGDLIVAGATENRVGALFAGMWVLFEWIEDTAFMERIESGAASAMRDVALTSGRQQQVLLVAGAVVALAVLGWLVSILLTVLNFHGFTLRRRRDGLHRRHGLLTRFEGVIPLRRIQVLRVESTLPRRWLRRACVRASTAGSVKDADEASDTTLCPLLRSARAGAFCREVFDDLDLDGVELRPVHRLTLRRGFVRVLLLGLPVVGAAAWVEAARLGGVARAPYALLPLVVVAFLWTRARYAALGYAVAGRFLVARAGVFTRRTWIVPEGKIQSVAVRRSPFQRWLGLASVELSTAGGGSWSTARVIDLGLDDALGLLERLTVAAAGR